MFPYSLKETSVSVGQVAAEALGLKRERVRQIRDAALRKLRKAGVKAS